MKTALDPAFFGERLRVAMAKKDWSGADLARALKMTRASVAPWMRGVVAPPFSRTVDIAKALAVDVSWLIAQGPVDLHGVATDAMRATVIGMHVAGLFTEGQTAKATGLHRVEVRRRADAIIANR